MGLGFMYLYLSVPSKVKLSVIFYAWIDKFVS